MFKSISTKFIITVMTIIIISFAVLAFIVGSTIASYSVDERKTVTQESAVTVKDFLENEINRVDSTDLGTFVVQNNAYLKKTFTLFTSYEKGLMLLLTDLDGVVLLKDNLAPSEYPKATIPIATVNEVLENGSLNKVSDFNQLFKQKHLYHAIPVIDTSMKPCGVIFAISTDSSLNQLSAVLIQTVGTAMVWVLLITLLTIYFISSKITAPLKKISKAAKEFARGNFTVRVPVKGVDEIAQLSESFNNMAEALENHEKTRSSFIANVSHDLRTPMTSISGFIDGILAGAIPPEKYDHYLHIVATEVKRLSRLVSSLLEISRFEAGEKKLNIVSFDICEMARQILISFEKKIEEKNLDVEFDCDDFNIFVKGDKDSIHQILFNICDNAVKFSRNGGKYLISIKQKAKQVFISVYNEGTGISPEDLPYIFDRFYKSDKSRGLDKTGVGLGLYISKTIIEAHNQEIWAKSAYGEYCEFVFTLEKE